MAHLTHRSHGSARNKTWPVALALAFTLSNLLSFGIGRGGLTGGVAYADTHNTPPSVTNHDTTFDNTAPRVGGTDNASQVLNPSQYVPNSLNQCSTFPLTDSYLPFSENWYHVPGTSEDTTIEGQVVDSKFATDDDPITHHSRDLNFLLYPDPPYQHYLSWPGNWATGENIEQGRIETEWEMQSQAAPTWAWPNVGDRVHEEGDVAFDCGHGGDTGYRTEMHPPRLLEILRGAAQTPGFWPSVEPQTGSIPIPTTRADVYASSDGGEAREDLNAEVGISSSNDWYQPLADSDYTLWVPAPPQPAGNYQMQWTDQQRPLPDERGVGPMARYLPVITPGTNNNQPGVWVSLPFKSSGFVEPANQYYGVGDTITVYWTQRASQAPRRFRVEVTAFQVNNPMDGSLCISDTGYCDGQWGISVFVGDQVQPMLFSGHDVEFPQAYPYSDDVNTGRGGVVTGCPVDMPGPPLCTDTTNDSDNAGNCRGTCRNEFDVTVLPGGTFRVYSKGSEHEVLSENQQIGVVEHIFTAAENYGLNGGIDGNGKYQEWWQEKTSAGSDALSDTCPCGYIEYQITEIPYPAIPATTHVLDPTSPQYSANGVTYVTSGTNINLAASVADSGPNSIPESFPGDRLRLHYRAYPDGSLSPPADTICADQPGPVGCTAHIIGADGPYTLEYWTEDVTTGVFEPVQVVHYTLDTTPPVITINQPTATTYTHSSTLTLNYTVSDGTGSGVASVTPLMDGAATVGGQGLGSGQAINLLTEMSLGSHTFTIAAADHLGNADSASVTFTIIVTAQSIQADVSQFVATGQVTLDEGNSLLKLLQAAATARAGGDCAQAALIYQAFINELEAQSGKNVDPTAAAIMTADAQYLITHCP